MKLFLLSLSSKHTYSPSLNFRSNEVAPENCVGYQKEYRLCRIQVRKYVIIPNTSMEKYIDNTNEMYTRSLNNILEGQHSFFSIP